MKKNRLRVEELALSVGVSVKTVNNWYSFKKLCPDNEYAQMLPAFEQEHERATRYWDPSAVFRLREFQTALPKGRVGVMGGITQKYLKKEKTNGKKNTKRNRVTADES